MIVTVQAEYRYQESQDHVAGRLEFPNLPAAEPVESERF